MTEETSWSLGFLIGLPALVVLTAAFLFIARLILRKWQPDSFDKGLQKPLGLIAIGCALVVVLVGVFGFYPYKAEYHQWSTVSGEVTDINSRVVSTGSKSFNQRFVASIDGVGDRACDDTRCANVEVGDILTLSCKREWQFTGTDGYGCNFVKVEAKS